MIVMFSALVLLDLSAAFDTISHDVQQDVCNLSFGSEGHSLAWFRSYMTNHSQSFCVTSGKSFPVVLPSRFPQGSVIGPQVYHLHEGHIDTTDKFSVNHYFYADNTHLQKNSHISDIRSTILNMELCRRCQGMVFLQTTSTQHRQYWGHLVWLQSKPVEAISCRYKSPARVNYY